MKTPKSERIHIGFFGRTNVGKSSLINFIAGQNVSIISEIAGTTTDLVEKNMEFPPIGPIVLIDTAGIDDNSILGEKRKIKTEKSFAKIDFGFLITEAEIWTEFEENIAKNFRKFDIPYIIVINKIDLKLPTEIFLDKIKKINKFEEINQNILQISTNTKATKFSEKRDDFLEKREEFLKQIKNSILENISNDFLENFQENNLLNDLIKPKEICIFVTPIDSGSPKGRLIMPQIRALRAALDKNVISLVVQLDEYLDAINSLKNPPKIVICDSQIVKNVIELSPENQKITTFSIIFAREKGDFDIEINSVFEIDKIHENDKILIAEACSHHSQNDDIAKVKIPKLLEKYLKFKSKIDYSNGRDYPANISDYKLVIHCGACMLTKKEKLNRINEAQNAGVPITNFGMTISFLNGYLQRVLQPFKKNV
jgi:[FeFe] hydrogenase H-cluster maturation GTPase HydF